MKVITLVAYLYTMSCLLCYESREVHPLDDFNTLILCYPSGPQTLEVIFNNMAIELSYYYYSESKYIILYSHGTRIRTHACMHYYA